MREGRAYVWRLAGQEKCCVASTANAVKQHFSLNMELHQSELKRANEELQALLASGEASNSEVADVRQKFGAQYDAKDREMAAIYREWCKQNPGKKMMEFGGKETQRIYEKVTGETSSPAPGSGSGSKTPSAEEMVLDQSSLSADGCPPAVKQIMKQEGAEEMVLAHGFFVIHCNGCTKPIEHPAPLVCRSFH
jgi:hypothetical protein